MNGAEFAQSAISELHMAIIEDVKVLTPQQLAWKPAPKTNPVGFLFWHFFRSEDNSVQGLQGKPAVWETGKWYEKLGLDAKAQGTGFQEPDVEKISRLPLTELMSYAQSVIQATDSYLKSLNDAALDQAPDPSRPKRTVAATLRSIVLAHGWWHLGEIKYNKGMQGMPAFR